MVRQFRFVLVSGAALVALTQTSAPARAQESDALEDEARSVQGRLEIVREFERQLREAEQFRLRGDCRNVAAMDEDVRTTAMMTSPELARLQADFQARMREIALRECPPGSGTPSIQVPPASPATTPAGVGAAPAVPSPSGAVPGAALTPAQAERLELVRPMVTEMEAAAKRGDCRRAAELRDSFLQLSFSLPNEVRDPMIAQMRAIYEQHCVPRFEPQRYYSVGSSWFPVRDIRFRASSGTAVRAPSVIELFAPATRVFTEETGIGVTRDGPLGQAPERDAGLTAGSISTIGIGAAVHLGKFSFYGSYQDGSGRTLFDLAPIAGGFNGFVFGQLSEAGSSGIGSGLASLTGNTRTQVSRFRLGGDMEIASPSPRTRVFFSYDYFRDVRTHEMDGTGTVVFPTQTIEFSQQRRQRISDNFYAAGLGAETRIPLTPDGADGGAGLSARLIGVVEGYLLDSSLSSHERNLSNFGPASDRDFTIDVQQNEQGFGVTARGQINLEYVVSPQFAIFVGGTADWFSKGGAVSNPNSGDQVAFDGLSTGLVDGEFWSYGAIVGLRVPIR